MDHEQDQQLQAEQWQRGAADQQLRDKPIPVLYGGYTQDGAGYLAG